MNETERLKETIKRQKAALDELRNIIESCEFGLMLQVMFGDAFSKADDPEQTT